MCSFRDSSEPQGEVVGFAMLPCVPTGHDLSAEPSSEVLA